MSEQEQRIMYCCTNCVDNYSEACGYFDRNDLRVLPDGRWLCDGCFDDTDQTERGNDNEDDEYRGWGDLPAPQEYVALPPSQPAPLVGTGKEP